MGLLGDAWNYIVAYVIDLVHPYQYVVACCLLIPVIGLLLFIWDISGDLFDFLPWVGEKVTQSDELLFPPHERPPKD